MGKMINFRHVNAEGDFPALLRHHGLEFTQKGSQIRLLCPFHDDTDPSLSITTTDTDQAKANTYHCFGCGAKGSVIDFEAEISKVDLRAAAETVASVSGCDLAPRKTKKKAAPQKRGERPGAAQAEKGARAPADPPAPADAAPADLPATNSPLNFALNLDFGHEAVLRRLDEEAAEFFGVGVANRGSMKDRICIPIHNADGELVAYAGRWPDEDTPDGEDKYRFPPRFNKLAELYNLHRLQPKTQHIVLVEGFFSAMRLHQLGVPVVALMGTAISEQQVTLLRRHGVKSVLVLLDGDEPGRKANEAVGLCLVRHLFARVVQMPDGTAPDDVDEQTLSGLLPYWLIQNQF